MLFVPLLYMFVFNSEVLQFLFISSLTELWSEHKTESVSGLKVQGNTQKMVTLLAFCRCRSARAPR